MKKLTLLFLLLVVLTGCASFTNPNDSIQRLGTITKYNGEYENYFSKCRASTNSGSSGEKSCLFDSHNTVGFDFENNIELDDNSFNKISEDFSRESKSFQTSTMYFSADYYVIFGTAKIVNSHDPHNSVIISNGLMRNIYEARSAEDKFYWITANDLNGDGYDDILVSPAYYKPQYRVRFCTLYDGKTLEEIGFLDKNLFIKENDKVQLMEYLDTNTSQLATWFKNMIHITEEEYPGNVVMEPSFINVDGETCVIMKFQKLDYNFGNLYIVYSYKEGGMKLKYILLNEKDSEVNEDDEG